MNQHDHINTRSLAMARAIAAKIDNDPLHTGLDHARLVCTRWNQNRPQACTAEWLNILNKPWEEIKPIWLEESDNGNRLRQSDPFCGILTPQERWQFF